MKIALVACHLKLARLQLRRSLIPPLLFPSNQSLVKRLSSRSRRQYFI